MPFFNALSDKIDQAVPTRAKDEPKAGTAKPVAKPKVRGPSTNPEVMAAVAAAKKRQALQKK